MAFLIKRFGTLALLIVSFSVFFAYQSRQSDRKTGITLDPTITYQTMMGWEAVAQAGQKDCRSFNIYKDDLFDAAINDLGINRLRVAIRPTGKESLELNLPGFDYDIENVVIPMMQLAQARGEKLFVNVNFTGPSGFTGQPDMSAYAEQVLGAYNHLQDKYGFYPDAWEVALEPGVVSPGWNSDQINGAVTSTNDLLISSGISNPYLIAPSSPCGPQKALETFDQMLNINNGTPPRGLDEFAYHRYCIATDQDLQEIGSFPTTYGFNTSMLEHGGGDYEELHADLKLANVSAWQQFALAYCTADNGYQYYPIQGDTFSLGERSKFLRQYFKFIRMGAVRIQASSGSPDFDPLAFINTDGSYVVVIKAETGGAFEIEGLPHGVYGIKYTTDHQFDMDLPNIELASGQALNSMIPEKGVITIYSQVDETQDSSTSQQIYLESQSPPRQANGKTCHIKSIFRCRRR